MHLLLPFVAHTVEPAGTEETRGQDYQGYWEKNNDIRLHGLATNLAFHNSVCSCYNSQMDLVLLRKQSAVAENRHG